MVYYSSMNLVMGPMKCFFCKLKSIWLFNLMGVVLWLHQGPV